MNTKLASMVLAAGLAVGCVGAQPVGQPSPILPAETQAPSSAASPSPSPRATAAPSTVRPTPRPSEPPAPTAPAAAATPAPTPAVPLTIDASIEGFRFEPGRLTVARGATVVWTNLDPARHTVTSGAQDEPDGRFDSGVLEQDGTFELRFDEAGTFPFFCNLHPRMIGAVEVGP